MSRVTEAHLEARRRAILDAAARVFASKGVTHATMAEIAEAAGISAGAIYRYFESKQALSTACFAEGTAVFAQQWKREFESAQDPREAFDAIAGRAFEEILDPGSTDRTRIMLEQYLDSARRGQGDEDRAHYEQIVGALTAGLQRMSDAGQLSPTLAVRPLAEALYAFWLGARIVYLLDGDAGRPPSQLVQVRALLDLAGAAGEPGARTLAPRARKRPALAPV